jgi:hypothetical protein
LIVASVDKAIEFPTAISHGDIEGSLPLQMINSFLICVLLLHLGHLLRQCPLHVMNLKINREKRCEDTCYSSTQVPMARCDARAIVARMPYELNGGNKGSSIQSLHEERYVAPDARAFTARTPYDYNGGQK